MTMEEIEKIAIEHTLRSVGYDKQKAAEILGIGLRTLYRKQKRYRLDRDTFPAIPAWSSLGALPTPRHALPLRHEGDD
jgi:transposase